MTLRENNGSDIIYLLVEKNEVINFEKKSSITPKDPKNSQFIDLPKSHFGLTFSDIISKTAERMGSLFIPYDPISNNCQVFTLNIAESIGHITPEVRDFIKQDNIEVLLPPDSFAGKFAKFTTDTASYFHKLIHGGKRNKKGGCKGISNCPCKKKDKKNKNNKIKFRKRVSIVNI